MIYPSVSGQYIHGPLYLRAEHKLSTMIDAALQKTGAQEIRLPILQPIDLWQKSGRFDLFKRELFTLEDRKGRGFLLSPTCEEQISTWLNQVKPFARGSFPLIVYQKNHKFRDELGGGSINRTREFLMYDTYFWAEHAEQIDAIGLQMIANLAEIFVALGVAFYQEISRESVSTAYAGYRSINLYIPTEIGTGNLLTVCPPCQAVIRDDQTCPVCGSATTAERIKVMEVARYSPLGQRFPSTFQLTSNGQPLHMGCLGTSPIRFMMGILGQLFSRSRPVWPVFAAPFLIVLLEPGLKTLAGQAADMRQLYATLTELTQQTYAPAFLRDSILLDDRTTSYAKKHTEWHQRGMPYLVEVGSERDTFILHNLLRDERQPLTGAQLRDQITRIVQAIETQTRNLC